MQSSFAFAASNVLDGRKLPLHSKWLLLFIVCRAKVAVGIWWLFELYEVKKQIGFQNSRDKQRFEMKRAISIGRAIAGAPSRPARSSAWIAGADLVGPLEPAQRLGKAAEIEHAEADFLIGPGAAARARRLVAMKRFRDRPR